MFQKLIRGNVVPDFRKTSGLLGACISMSWISTPQTFHQLYPHTQVQKIRHANIYDAYSKALEIFTSERAPMEWAAIQNNLGKILIISGELENNPQRIEDGRAILSKYFKNAPENSVR